LFQRALLDAGLTATVRWSKGEDVGAACGQLAS
jgi:23S rRNA (adenine2503-C2)-methyltransferase